MRRAFIYLGLLALILISCGAPASTPMVVETRGLVAPTDTLALASPTLTPSASPALPTSTPAPTSTETLLPTLELPTLALNPPPLAVWDGVPTYLADSAPGYDFRLQYDPERWALVIDQLGQPALSHRTIPYCLVTPSSGRGLPPSVTVEHETIYYEDLSIDVGKAYQAGSLAFVTYQVSNGTIFTGFEVNFQEDMEACMNDALAVVETLKPVPASQATPQP